MLGASIGRGLITYQLARSEKGLSRIEVGRSSFRYASSPSFAPAIGSSLRYFFISEAPLYVNMPILMGMQRFNSDDDDEADMGRIYTFNWKPEASLSRKRACMCHG